MSMMDIAQTITDNLSASVPLSEGEYIGEDGLAHCSVCHKATQTRINVLGMDKVVRCICDCRKKELDKQKEREKWQKIQRQRSICFSNSSMYAWTFKNDDNHNPKITAAMMRYVDSFDKFRKEGQGLLLHGTVGTGKSFYAAAIANKLIDRGYTAHMTNFASIINTMQASFDGKKELIESLCRYSLLVIDDLGAERNTDYSKEIVFNVIDARYQSGKPFVVTTNLSLDTVTDKNADISYKRIYDRIIERCYPVAIDGGSRRRKNVQKSFYETQKILGI